MVNAVEPFRANSTSQIESRIRHRIAQWHNSSDHPARLIRGFLTRFRVESL
jgi:hypothetical protein